MSPLLAIDPQLDYMAQRFCRASGRRIKAWSLRTKVQKRTEELSHKRSIHLDSPNPHGLPPTEVPQALLNASLSSNHSQQLPPTVQLLVPALILLSNRPSRLPRR